MKNILNAKILKRFYFLFIFLVFLWSPIKTSQSIFEEIVSLVLIQNNTLKGFSSPVFFIPQVLATLNDNTLTKQEGLNFISEKYPTMKEGLSKLWFCEASYQHTNTWGDNGLSYGAFMFRKQTFQRYCQGDRQNFIDQLDCVVLMIKKGLGPTTQGWYNCWYKENLFKYF